MADAQVDRAGARPGTQAVRATGRRAADHPPTAGNDSRAGAAREGHAGIVA